MYLCTSACSLVSCDRSTRLPVTTTQDNLRCDTLSTFLLYFINPQRGPPLVMWGVIKYSKEEIKSWCFIAPWREVSPTQRGPRSDTEQYYRGLLKGASASTYQKHIKQQAKSWNIFQSRFGWCKQGAQGVDPTSKFPQIPVRLNVCRTSPIYRGPTSETTGLKGSSVSVPQRVREKSDPGMLSRHVPQMLDRIGI